MNKNRNTNILVIGAAHLDVVADYSDEEVVLDKRGTLNLSLGGTAYNIATNLCDKKFKISLLTALNTQSISGEIIHRTLKRLNINTDFVIDAPLNWESGFVALTKKHVIQSAVSSTLIERVAITDKIEKAVSATNVIVIDCNLSRLQIQNIVNIAAQRHPLFVCAVSEIKMREATEIHTTNPYPYEFFFMNNLEAIDFLKFKGKNGSWKSMVNKDEVKELCSLFKSKNVVITNGSIGYKIFSYNGDFIDCQVNPMDSKYSLGAGDALVAAVVDHYVTNKGKMDWNICQTLINDYTSRILSIPEATLYAKYTQYYPEMFGFPDKSLGFDVFGIIPYTPYQYLKIWEQISGELKKRSKVKIGIADDVNTPHFIMRNIWSSIYHSKCIIADCSNRNPNVFYELGIAHSLGKNVICISNDTDNIPFDIRHLKCINYENSDKGVLKLCNTLCKVLTEMKII